MKYIKHMKYILPADRYIKQIPDYSAFGRKTTFRMNPDKIPDLHWNLANKYHIRDIGQVDAQVTCISTHCIDVATLSHGEGNRCGNWCGTTLNTDTIILQSNIDPVVCSVIHNSKHKLLVT